MDISKLTARTIHLLAMTMIIFGFVVAATVLRDSTVHAQDADGYAPTSTPIKHLIFLMQENHSFDNYFGTYPGADGIPSDTCMPVDPFNDNNTECVEPFRIGDNEVELADPDHSDMTHKIQYNEGKMNGFVHALNIRNQDGRLAMGYYDAQELTYYWTIVD